MALRHGLTRSTMLSCHRQIGSGFPRVVQFSRRCGSIPKCRPFLPRYPTSSNINSRVGHHHRRTEGVTTIPCRLLRFLRREILRDTGGIMGRMGRPERRFTRDGRMWTGSSIRVWRRFRGFLLGSGSSHRSSSKGRLYSIIIRDISSSSSIHNNISISTRDHQ